MSGFTFSDFKALRDDLVRFERDLEKIHLQVAKRVGELIKRRVKLLSPVDVGDLRDGWRTDVYRGSATLTKFAFITSWIMASTSNLASGSSLKCPGRQLIERWAGKKGVLC